MSAPNGTWPQFDYGRKLRQYVLDDGTLGPIPDLSTFEVQALSKVIVSRNVRKITYGSDKWSSGRLKGHTICMPLSSPMRMWETQVDNVPRTDVPVFNQILFVGTKENYTRALAAKLNAEDHSFRSDAVLKGAIALCQVCPGYGTEHVNVSAIDDAEWETARVHLQEGVVFEGSACVREAEGLAQSDIAAGFDTSSSDSILWRNVLVCSELRMEDTDDVLLSKALTLSNDIAQAKDPEFVPKRTVESR